MLLNHIIKQQLIRSAPPQTVGCKTVIELGFSINVARARLDEKPSNIFPPHLLPLPLSSSMLVLLRTDLEFSLYDLAFLVVDLDEDLFCLPLGFFCIAAVMVYFNYSALVPALAPATIGDDDVINWLLFSR